jgi:type IV/VI secretion system ImpK/VasF family protein
VTGDSNDEVGNPGSLPVPPEEPRPSGEASSRPFRNWGAAYEAPKPSLWKRITGSFSRTSDSAPQVDDEPESDQPLVFLDTGAEPADEARIADPEPVEAAAEASADDYDHDAFDAAFDSPSPLRDDQALTETVDDLEPIVDAAAEPELLPVAEQPVAEEPRKSGIFARLFGRRSKSMEPPEEIVSPAPLDWSTDASAEARHDEIAEPVSEVDEFASATSDDAASVSWLDRVEESAPSEAEVEPEIPDFLQAETTGVEGEATFEGPTLDEAPLDEPTLDDALPTDDAEPPPPYVEQPTQPWPGIGADEEPVVDRKPGFFARIFGRKSRSVEELPDAVSAESGELQAEGATGEEIVARAEDAFADRGAMFTHDDAEATREDALPFASVEDALPVPDAQPSFPDATLSDPDVTLSDVPFPDVILSDDPDVTLSGVPVPDMPLRHAAQRAPADTHSLFGDTIDPGDIQPSSDSPTMEEIDSRPTMETTARDTVQATPLDDESTDEFVPPVPIEVDPKAEASRGPFFVPKFRSFYNEIVLYKHQKSQFTGGFATAIVDYSSDLSPDAAAKGLSARLNEILDLQLAESTWLGGEAAARYPDAQYAMAVLADELFTHMDWPGQFAWPQYLLEPRIFRTRAAEVEFFKRVDKLLKNEAEDPSPAAKDLARMYLLVLASGFKGKYRQPGLVRPLAEYRRRLYEFVSGQDPLLLYADERRIFPEATERTLESKAIKRFSGLQQWAAALILILLSYTLLANFAWKRVSADLTDVTARVEAANRTSSSGGAWSVVAGDSLP